MKRIFLALFAVAALFAPPASAKDMGGKFGVGVDQTLGGVTGIEFKYFIGDFAASLEPQFSVWAPKEGKNQFALAIALGGVYYFARSDQANLGFGAKVSMGYLNKAANNGTDSTFQANVELPLVMEYYFSDHFAFHVSTGLLFVIVPEKGPALSVPGHNGGIASIGSKEGFSSGGGSPNTSAGENDGSASIGSKEGFGFSFGGGSLTTSAGFTFYF